MPSKEQVKYLERAMEDFKKENADEHDDIKSKNSEEHKDIKENIRNINTTINASFNTLSKKIDDLDGRFSPKWVEWFAKILIAALISGGLGTVVYFIQGHL